MWYLSWKHSGCAKWYTLTYATLDRMTSVMDNMQRAHKEDVKFKCSWREQ